jgi:hypothetical protein
MAVKAKPLALGQPAKLLQMRVRAGGQQETDAEMFGIG